MPSVTLVSLETTPDTELPIGEVAHITGYTSLSLRRLEKEGLIPQSHRKNQMRYWFAGDVKKIIDHRAKMVQERKDRMATLYKKGVRARRA